MRFVFHRTARVASRVNYVSMASQSGGRNKARLRVLGDARRGASAGGFSRVSWTRQTSATDSGGVLFTRDRSNRFLFYFLAMFPPFLFSFFIFFFFFLFSLWFIPMIHFSAVSFYCDFFFSFVFCFFIFAIPSIVLCSHTCPYYVLHRTAGVGSQSR